MLINKTEIQPGEVKRIDVNIARLPSRSTIDISITVARAEKEGPVLLLMGGLHGDEINGVEIVRRIIEQDMHIPQIGTVICIPILNIYGFIHFSRNVPDGKDVNRSFPGNKNGSLASRVANYLTREILPKVDFGIDFHTGGAERFNHPQIRCLMKDEKDLEMAKAFKAPFIVNSKYRPKSLRLIAAKAGKNILIYEAGESSRFDEYAITEGINGTIRTMKYLGMEPETKNLPEVSEAIIIRKSSWVRARVSGIFQCKVVSGEKISKNQLVGYITDPFGEFKRPIKSNTSGYILGLNNNPLLHQGDAVVHIGVT